MYTVSHSSLTPLRFLERSAEVYPDKVAIVHGDRRTSYRHFASEATRLAHAAGVGDRSRRPCGIPMSEHPGAPDRAFRRSTRGAVLVAINTRLAPEEVRYICDHSGAKLLVVDSELRSIIDPVAEPVRDDPRDRHGDRSCGRARHWRGFWRPSVSRPARAWIRRPLQWTSRTSSRRSRSITRRELRENPRESCTRIGARI